MKQFIEKIWKQFIHFISPRWIGFPISLITAQSRFLFQKQSQFYFHTQSVKSLKEKITKLEKELAATKNSVKSWKEAWFDQRDATGKNYWDGFRDGKKIAIKFHSEEASKRLNAAKLCSNPKDKLNQELDARFHTYSIEQINLRGHDVKAP